MQNLQDKMYEDDADGKTLKLIEPIAEEVESYKIKIIDLCDILIEEGLKRLKVSVQIFKWYYTGLKWVRPSMALWTRDCGSNVCIF